MSKPRLLLAEDDSALAPIMESILSDAGFDVLLSKDGEAAWQAVLEARQQEKSFDLIVADINMPKLDGLALIDRLRESDQDTPVIFVTAYSSVESAVHALRRGAFDYLTKPFRNDRLIQVARNAARLGALQSENRALRARLQRQDVDQAIRRLPGLAAVARVIERAGPTSASVLIRGETGSGKELVARALHQVSERSGGPFIAINCGALPEGLLESELFGHEKGAFSGAVAASQGLFRAAHKGTLFLDELGEMPNSLQVKLLRALESREVRPVGGTKALEIDVRVLAATHRDLLEDIQSGRFREDLYYRLAVIELEIPPLRARPADISILARAFLTELAQSRGQGEVPWDRDFLEALSLYDWPGNVRELRNAMEHALTLGGESLKRSDLPPRIQRALQSRSGEKPPPPPENETSPESPNSTQDLTLAELERRHIEAVLNSLAGDRKEAASRLGIDLSTLYRKIKRWEREGSDDPDPD